MKGKKERSLKLNIIASMAIQVVSLLVNLISKRAIRMYLGVEYLGIQSIYSNFCDVMSFAFFGIGTAMLFSMYGAFARNNEEEIASYYQHYDKIYRKISIFVLVGGILCTLLALYSVNGNVSVLEICMTYLTYMLSVVLYNRQLVRNYFIQADQRRYVVAFITGGVDAAALLAEVLILCYFRNYEYFLICILVKNLFINYLLKKYLQKNYAYIFKPAKTLEDKEKDTIAANIAFGKPNATMEEIVEAAKKAHADEFIRRMPEGYQTVVSNATGLSTGEKQLLCVARILLVQPEIVLLDEATSNIDLRTELALGKAFDELMRGKTSIVVAHRLSTIKNADLILVMKDGAVLEQGNFGELMAKNGAFADLYRSQLA